MAGRALPSPMGSANSRGALTSWLRSRPGPRGGLRTGADVLRCATAHVACLPPEFPRVLPVAGPAAVLPSWCALCSSSSHLAHGFQAFCGVAVRDTGPVRRFARGMCNASPVARPQKLVPPYRLPATTRPGPALCGTVSFFRLYRVTGLACVRRCPPSGAALREPEHHVAADFFRSQRPWSVPGQLPVRSGDPLRQESASPGSNNACAAAGSGVFELFRPRRQVAGNLGFFDAVEAVSLPWSGVHRSR